MNETCTDLLLYEASVMYFFFPSSISFPSDVSLHKGSCLERTRVIKSPYNRHYDPG